TGIIFADCSRKPVASRPVGCLSPGCRCGDWGDPVMTKRATWKPYEKHGELTERSALPNSVFAFPKNRKEPLTDASHVRNALARFDQVEGVSDADRDLAFANIKKAAEHYDVNVEEKSWHEL